MYKFSKEQQDFFSYLVDRINKGEKPKVELIAPAGTGKSSTATGVMDHFPNLKIAYLVFNTQMKNEFAQRLNFATSNFENINTDNIDVHTFYSYIRKELGKRFSHIRCDNEHGELQPSHLKELYPFLNNIENHQMGSFIEKLNEYSSAYIKTTLSFEDFKTSSDIDSIKLDRDLLVIVGRLSKNSYGLEDLENSMSLAKTETKDAFDGVLSSIYEKDMLNTMPHSVYYKYIYEKCGDENIFKEYDMLIMDEAQDNDPIFDALVRKSNATIAKMGDNFQQINAFRGTVNSLGSDDSEIFFLTKSYRLTPYIGLLSSAFLKEKGKEIGYDEKLIPMIYGHKNNPTKNSIGETRIQKATKDEFFSRVIEDIGSVVIEDTDIVQSLNFQKMQLDSTVNDKKEFERALKSFKKDRDYLAFFEKIRETTSYFGGSSSGTLEGLIDSPKSSISVDEMYRQLSNIGDNSAINDAQRELNKIAKVCGFKLNKKEMTEILATNGTYGFITRNNDESIDALYTLSKQMTSKDDDIAIPRYNIKFVSAQSEKLTDIDKHRFENLKTKDRGTVFNFLQNNKSLVIDGLDAKINYDILGSMEVSNTVLNILLKDESKVKPFVEAKMLKIYGITHSLSDYGVTSDEVAKRIKDAIKATKQAMTRSNITYGDEVTAEDVKAYSSLKNMSDFMSFSTFVKNTIGEDKVLGSDRKLIKNFYKLAEAKKALDENNSATMVNGAFYNIYISTAHQVKGLEFDNIYINADIFAEPNENTTERQKKDEIQLAYVTLTRTRNTVFSDPESYFIQQIEDLEKNAGYSRFYKTSKGNEAILEEKLTPLGVEYEVTYLAKRDSEELFMAKDSIIMTNNSEMLPYSRMVLAKTENGNFEILDKDKGGLSNREFFYIIPVEEEEAKNIIDQKKEIEMMSKEDLQREAEMVF